MLNQRIGALWKKTAKQTGQTFYSGQIDTPFGAVQISVFKNDKKEKDNHPDLNIVFNGCKPYEQRDRQSATGDDPFGDDGRASPTDDPFGDKAKVTPSGYDGPVDTTEPVIEL